MDSSFTVLEKWWCMYPLYLGMDATFFFFFLWAGHGYLKKLFHVFLEHDILAHLRSFVNICICFGFRSRSYFLSSNKDEAAVETSLNRIKSCTKACLESITWVKIKLSENLVSVTRRTISGPICHSAVTHSILAHQIEGYFQKA